MPIRTTQERFEKLVLHRDSIITEANLKGAEIPLNADYPEIISGLQRITMGLPEAEVEALLDEILGETIVGDYEDKGAAILSEKEAIRQAIIAKDVAVPAETPLSQFPAKIGEIENGGGSSYQEGDFSVQFIDFDGRIIKEQWVISGSSAVPPTAYEIYRAFCIYSHNEPLSQTEWEANGSVIHDKLVFREWNRSYENVGRDIDVGAVYDTVEGATFLQVAVGYGGRSMTIGTKISLYSGSQIDWGDGTVSANTSHTYINSGFYWIKITGNFTITHYIFNDTFINRSLIRAYFGANLVSISAYALYTCYDMTHVVLPHGLTSIGVLAFSSSYNLVGLVIPSSVTFSSAQSIMVKRRVVFPDSGTTFYGASGDFERITIPSTTVTFENSALRGLYCLTKVVIPEGVKALGTYALNNNRRLALVDVPASIETLGDNVFSGVYGVVKIIIRALVPPTAGTAVFDSVTSPYGTYFIYVPDASVLEYKTATNWEAYAEWIHPLSEFEV